MIPAFMADEALLILMLTAPEMGMDFGENNRHTGLIARKSKNVSIKTCLSEIFFANSGIAHKKQPHIAAERYDAQGLGR